ncbi:MAG: alanine racemase [Saprospiraceae bacterium]
MSIANLTTPAVLVDRNVLLHNILQLQRRADQFNIEVRPHIKTHKSIHIAKMQMENGAQGITAAKVSEAIIFIEAGIPSVTLAYPIVNEEKAEILFRMATEKFCELRLVIDSLLSFEIIKKAAQKFQKTVAIYIEIDTGLHRCGLSPTHPLIVDLAHRIQASTFLIFKGLCSHAGHSYAAIDRQQVKRIAAEELQQLRTAKKMLRLNSIDRIEIIAVGSTPTVLATDSFAGIEEIRAGNYVFMDRTPLRLDLIKKKHIALTVLATVVSVNEHYYIIDAGSKTLSSDRGAHGVIGMEGFGLVYPLQKYRNKKKKMLITQLSEEHGFVRRREGVKLKIGDKVRIIPNHSCVVMNLVDRFFLTQNGDVIEELPVDARGTIQ